LFLVCQSLLGLYFTMIHTTTHMIGKVLTEAPIDADAGNRFIVEIPYLDEKIKQIKTHRIRVFDSKKKEDDVSWFYQLPRVGTMLPIKFEIYGPGMHDCDFAGSAMKFDDQPPILKTYINSGLKEREPSSLLKEIRNDIAIVKAVDIDPIAHWLDNNPEVTLSKSQQRVRGKTDKELMTIVNIFAKRKGVKPCDVINAVMWNAVHDGSIWKTQITENDAES